MKIEMCVVCAVACVAALCGCAQHNSKGSATSASVGSPAVFSLFAKEKSGAAWVKKFPADDTVAALEDDFEKKVEAFIAAVKKAGVTPSIKSVYRPPERQHLMRWCWKIVEKNHDAQTVPAKEGVDIDWWHGDQLKSVKAAKEMYDGYGLDTKAEPPETSRHTEKKAIDMSITWTGSLTIKDKDDKDVVISSEPRNSSNADLIKVAKTYGVIHFINAASDVNHWSTDGK